MDTESPLNNVSGKLFSLPNLPDVSSAKKTAKAILKASERMTSEIADKLPSIPNAADYLSTHSPFDTLAKGFTSFVFQQEPPFQLKTNHIMSSMPNDTVKLSKETLETLDNQKIITLLKKYPTSVKGLQSLIKQQKNSAIKTRFYGTLTPAQKQGLDVFKFEELQQHLNQFCEHDQAGKLAEAKHVYTMQGLDYAQVHVGELLAKSLAYLHPDVLKDAGKIDIPVNGQLVSYAIDTHTMEGSELPFITLTPPEGSNAEPWLVIRGTDPNVVGRGSDTATKTSALESVLADTINKQGMANTPIDLALDQFTRICSELSQHAPINLAGHSLGGHNVQYLAVLLQEQKELSLNNVKLGNVYGFNSPGVSKVTKQAYTQLKDKPQLYNFNKVGDIVPNVGRCLIGTHFRVKGRDSVFHVAHRAIDTHDKHTLQKNDIEAEEKKGVRRLAEGVRRNLIGTAAGTGLKIARACGSDIAPWADAYL